MLAQFQKEFWTRFSIPLSRLDSAAIRRMRNQIPAHYNVFDQFDRSIVSIDTLKQDSQIRAAIEQSSWDLIIIDEAHNAAKARPPGRQLLAGRSSRSFCRARPISLLLLTATPHDGSQESFASLIEMLDPTRVPDPDKLHRDDIEDLVIRRFRSSPEVLAEQSEDRPASASFIGAASRSSEKEEAAYAMIAELQLDLDEEATSEPRHRSFPHDACEGDLLEPRRLPRDSERTDRPHRDGAPAKAARPTRTEAVRPGRAARLDRTRRFSESTRTSCSF